VSVNRPVLTIDPGHFEGGSPDTAAGVRRLVIAATRADAAAPLDEAAELTLRHRGLESAALWVVPGPSGAADENLIGFALADARPGSTGPVEVNLVVHPDARREGVGRALADAVLDAFPDARLAAWSHGNHPGAAALAERLGFAAVRDLWVMRRPLDEDLPAAAPPARVVVRTFEAGRDEDAVLAVNAEAFADHPEQGQLTRADLDQRLAEPWFDPAGLFLAEPADAPALGDTVESPSLLGFHWTKVHPAEADTPAVGEVYVVGISPAAQGTGLGKALTLTGLHHLRDRGLGEVILYVEADNTAAVALYSGLGFTHAEADTHVMYARPGH
jgi:mycothiol synthase